MNPRRFGSFGGGRISSDGWFESLDREKRKRVLGELVLLHVNIEIRAKLRSAR
jgi:hypothetical protein